MGEAVLHISRVLSFRLDPLVYCWSTYRFGPSFPTPEVASGNSALRHVASNNICTESVRLEPEFQIQHAQNSSLYFSPPLFITSCDLAVFPVCLQTRRFRKGFLPEILYLFVVSCSSYISLPNQHHLPRVCHVPSISRSV
jgi:hypothetical protein